MCGARGMMRRGKTAKAPDFDAAIAGDGVAHHLIIVLVLAATSMMLSMVRLLASCSTSSDFSMGYCHWCFI